MTKVVNKGERPTAIDCPRNSQRLQPNPNSQAKELAQNQRAIAGMTRETAENDFLKPATQESWQKTLPRTPLDSGQTMSTINHRKPSPLSTVN
jgi:hypothetical protein